MDTIARDLRHAVRALVRMRGTAVVAILTLSLGIGATTTMFSVVYALLVREPPFEAAERLVVLYTTSQDSRNGLVRWRWSMPDVTALRGMATSFESVASFTGPLLTISGRGDPEQVEGEAVSPEYFQTLRVVPVGRVFTAGEATVAGAQPVAMIGWRLWMRLFSGDAAALGATIVVNDLPLTIVGILPERFSGLSGKAEVWITPPLAAQLTYADYLTTTQHFINVVARLKPGVTLQQADAELAAISGRFLGAGSSPGTTWGAVGVALREARVEPTQRQSALVLLGAAGCVLVLACFNVASLLLARARVRQREFALRLALGAGRGRLVQQLLAEGLVLAAVAGLCGTALASWGVALVAHTSPAVIPSGRNFYATIGSLGAPALDPDVLIFAVGVALGTTLLVALMPALTASRLDLSTALKQDDRSGRRAGRAFSALVVAEVAGACLLLMASGLLIERFADLQGRRQGFVPEQVLTFWVRPPASRYPPAAGPATLERLLTRLEAVPGVASAAVNRCVPFSGCSRSLLFLPGGTSDPTLAPSVGRHYISADYFRTLGIPLLAGRVLSPADRAESPPVAVVNESGARRLWPGESAIGKRVWFGTTGPFSDRTRAVEIVGVVGDVKYELVDEPERPDRAEFYTSYLQFAYPDTMVVVKARSDAVGLLPSIRQAVMSIDATLPLYDVLTLDQRIDGAVSRPRLNAAFLAAFAGVALLLAAIGVYGMLSYSVSSRIRDIGVHLALGADARRVEVMVLGEGLRLAMAGAVLGLIASVLVARVLRGVLVGVPAIDARLLGAAAVIVLLVAAVSAFLPARRASAVDPLVVLRND